MRIRNPVFLRNLQRKCQVKTQVCMEACKCVERPIKPPVDPQHPSDSESGADLFRHPLC